MRAPPEGRIGSPARRPLAGAILCGLLVACAGGERPAAETEGEAAREAPTAGSEVPPDTVRIAEPGLHPEGIEWDAERGRFLVSSVTRGTVTAVEDDGSHRVLVEDPELGSSIGIHIDRESGRLLVASADLRVFQDTALRGTAKLGIYDLRSGERLHLVELATLRPGGRHFANDVAVGPDGTAYVTDSFSPVVYAVTPRGEASILVEDERLAATPIGLNGIEHHPDGYLLAAVAGRGALVKVPLEDPSALADVSLPEPIGADGLVLMEDGTLVAVVFGAADDPTSDVAWLRSDDDWASAEVVARAPSASATTATVRDGAVYAVDPHFSALGGGEPHPVFEILRVDREQGR